MLIPSKNRFASEELIEQWSTLYDLTKKVRRVLPSIWNVPEFGSNSVYHIAAQVASSGTFLDVGAADCSLGDFLKAKRPNIRYLSLDVDHSRTHDFYDWDSVNMTFETIAAFELIEHLDVFSAYQFFSRVWNHLGKGGIFIIGTPNIYHPNRWLQDPTHVTPWAYDRLCATLLAVGFDIQAAYRLGSPYGSGSWTQRLAKRFYLMLCKKLSIDSFDTICVVSSKSTNNLG